MGASITKYSYKSFKMNKLICGSFLTVIVLLGTTQGKPGKCYQCQNYDEAQETTTNPYDLECGFAEYDGNKKDCEDGRCHGCRTFVWEDGKVRRDTAGLCDEGECINANDGVPYIECFCTTGLCNIDLCEACQA